MVVCFVCFTQDDSVQSGLGLHVCCEKLKHTCSFAAGQGHHCSAQEAQSSLKRTDSQADCAKNPGVQLPNPKVWCGRNGR